MGSSYGEVGPLCETCKYQHLYPKGEPCIRCNDGSFYYRVMEKLTNDSPTSPTHYSRFPIQPIDFIAENKLNFLAGNIIKYVCRYDAKNGVEDLEKAKVYLEKLIEQTKKEQKNNV